MQRQIKCIFKCQTQKPKVLELGFLFDSMEIQGCSLWSIWLTTFRLWLRYPADGLQVTPSALITHHLQKLSRYSWKILTRKQTTAGPWTHKHKEHQLHTPCYKTSLPEENKHAFWMQHSVALPLRVSWYGLSGRAASSAQEVFLPFSQEK